MNNPLPGWMTQGDLQAINQICSQVMLGTPILEIGSFLGRSTIQWAAQLPCSKVVCVDAWQGAPKDYVETWYLEQCWGDHKFMNMDQPMFPQFLKNTRDFTNIVPIRMSSTEFEWVWHMPPKVIFIDGDHTDSGVKSDLEACYKRWCSTSDTIICGHDYNPKFNNSVVRQVSQFAQLHHMQIQHYPDTTVFQLKRCL